jgi:hypothetical protein
MEMDGANNAINELLASWEWIGHWSGVDWRRSTSLAKFKEKVVAHVPQVSTPLGHVPRCCLNCNCTARLMCSDKDRLIPKSKRTADDGTSNLCLFDG